MIHKRGEEVPNAPTCSLPVINFLTSLGQAESLFKGTGLGDSPVSQGFLLMWGKGLPRTLRLLEIFLSG